MTPLPAWALTAALLAGPRGDSVPRYDLVARFDDDMRAVSVVGELHVPQSLLRGDTLELRLSRLFRELRFTDANGQVVSAVPLGDAAAEVRHYRLLVRAARDTVRLHFSYRGAMASRSVMHWTARPRSLRRF